MTFGKKLYDLRISKNLTKEKLAQELGISKTAYGKWENDLAKPKFDNINSICKFYNLSIDELISNQENDARDIMGISTGIHHLVNPISILSSKEEITRKFLSNQKIIIDLIESQYVLFKELQK